MTQADKDLLLKDLCARLPYGVKVLCLRDSTHKWYNLERIDIRDNEAYLTTKTFGSYLNKYVGIEVVKPYLFPLSSMTEEQKAELEQIKNNEDAPYYHDINDFFLKYHLDNRHLIEKGLAIDATGLNIY